jgi:hypothetical protein
MMKARHPQLVRQRRRVCKLLSVHIFTKLELNMTTIRWSKVTLFASVLALALPGCSESVPPPPEENLVPVSGTVKVGGKPAAGVSVSFVPVGSTSGHGSFAVTDSQGFFELLHHQSQELGVPKGNYTVRFSKFLKPDGTPVPEGESPYMAGGFQSIPGKWSDPGQAGEHNKVTVPSGGKEFDFDIPAQ